MGYEPLLYEAGVLFLIVSCVYTGIVLNKLTGILGKKESVWIMPIAAGAVLLVALVSHAYATFIMLPQLEKSIELLISGSAAGSEAVKGAIAAFREGLLQLKALSFTCFFAAALLMSAAAGTYLKWISK